MTLYKVDTKNWTVREVQSDPWPGKDSDGEICYENTHFTSERAAWEKLKAEVDVGVCCSGRTIQYAKRQLAAAEQEAGRLAEAMMKVCEQLRARK